MTNLFNKLDPDGLLDYSVVYSNRALNHMSICFQTVMQDISGLLKEVYNAAAVAIVPGGGSYAMEAIACQLARNKHCFCLRNGFFNYRWSQILAATELPICETVIMASPSHDGKQAPYAPAPIDKVAALLRLNRPDLVFATHVETSAGSILPDDYITQLAELTHRGRGLLILDCIASGATWIDMKALGVDIVLSVPQKGWSSSPCAGLIMLSQAAIEAIFSTQSTSFALDLRKWLEIMQAYEQGSHRYHCTLPTDCLSTLRNTLQEARTIGFTTLREQQDRLGAKMRTLLHQHGFVSVAAQGFQAPSVIVCYTRDPELHSGQKFAELGIQISAGVPLMCDEAASFQSFRLGLFGLDKLADVDGTVARFAEALDRLAATTEQRLAD